MLFTSPPRAVRGVVTRCPRCLFSKGTLRDMRCVRLGIPVRPDFFCANCKPAPWFDPVEVA